VLNLKYYFIFNHMNENKSNKPWQISQTTRYFLRTQHHIHQLDIEADRGKYIKGTTHTHSPRLEQRTSGLHIFSQGCLGNRQRFKFKCCSKYVVRFSRKHSKLVKEKMKPPSGEQKQEYTSSSSASAYWAVGYHWGPVILTSNRIWSPGNLHTLQPLIAAPVNMWR
jgi:hypothetical protein